TDHQIARIIVWAKDGEVSQEDVKCDMINRREQRNFLLFIDMFPLTVDVVEVTPGKVLEGSKEAESDTHRHGPFASDNFQPVQPGHRVKTKKDGEIPTQKEEEDEKKKK